MLKCMVSEFVSILLDHILKVSRPFRQFQYDVVEGTEARKADLQAGNQFLQPDFERDVKASEPE